MDEFKKEQTINHENPFKDPEVARQWINSVENEKGMIRDKEIYPKLEQWVKLFNPKIVLDIGAGQGICSAHVCFLGNKYIGIEPSSLLVERANELYFGEDKDFIIGDAYDLPIMSEFVDAAFSVNVWFHLENLSIASKELSRVLKPGGKFLIITANPQTYDIWRTMYYDAVEDDRKIVGKVKVPVNPMTLNIFYKHTLEEIRSKLIDNNLIITGEEEFGYSSAFTDRPIFVCIFGYKK